MNIYLISQNENNGYDTYSDAVVAALNPKNARNMNPAGENFKGNIFMTKEDWAYRWSEWASKPENVTVKLIGVAKKGIKEGVICASFHAG
jgi:hypothetical protein